MLREVYDKDYGERPWLVGVERGDDNLSRVRQLGALDHDHRLALLNASDTSLSTLAASRTQSC
jgi:hypothetical protein